MCLLLVLFVSIGLAVFAVFAFVYICVDLFVFVPQIALAIGVGYQLCRGSRWVPLLRAMLGCHCWVPLREKIDQSVAPFSAASFSTLITHKLTCAIWGLCWYNLCFLG